MVKIYTFRVELTAWTHVLSAALLWQEYERHAVWLLVDGASHEY
jgi:hypothetical protein